MAEPASENPDEAIR
jgi:hypothetical protein